MNHFLQFPSMNPPHTAASGIVVDDTDERKLRESGLGAMESIDVDKMLSKNLNSMSLEERTQGIHELHGVADEEDESLDRIQLKTKEIGTFIDASCTAEETAAYRLAIEMNPEYVESIKLLCLRAEAYDSEKAACRIASFFAFKLELFGFEKLARDITLDDFQGEDRAGLNQGIFQLIQQRDRAGRAIIMFTGSKAPEFSAETGFRVFYFVTMNALRDPEIQKKGVVFIIYTIGQSKFHSDRPKRLAVALSRLPFRLVAVHICYDKKLLDLAMKLLCQNMEGKLLCRFRGHYGSYFECTYNLMTFGIPKHVLPINMENGTMDLSSHLRWLETVHAREQMARRQQQIQIDPSSSPSSTSRMMSTTGSVATPLLPNIEIAVPGPMDIIVGRGSLSRSSPGYLRMRNLVQAHKEAYEKAGKTEKTSIAKSILYESHQAGCRFLRQTPEGYVLCNEVQAREKISHAFRNMRRPPKDGAPRGKSNKRNFPVVILS